MLPDSQKGFAPVIHGIARGTAQVSIKQNGYEIYQSTVPPGPFTIDDLYAAGNGGDLQVTIKEPTAPPGLHRALVNGAGAAA
jgi:outer membrane usher protein